MEIFRCNAFNLKDGELKVIDGVLTTKDVNSITSGYIIPPNCGGIKLDKAVFKIDESTQAVTKVGTTTVTKTVSPYCGGIILDGDVFEIKADKVASLIKTKTKEAPTPVTLMSSTSVETPTTNITFESDSDFTVVLKDDKGDILEQTELNKYIVPKNANYTYEATSGIKVLTGSISTNRKVDITKTLKF